MNCDGVRGLLSAYVDGELSAGELLRVEQHLRRCHACADEVDSLRQTIALVASLDEVEVPASFHTQLHARLAALGPPVAGVRRTRTASPLHRTMPRWAVPAAAAAALLAIGITSLQQVKETGSSGQIITSLFPSELAAGHKPPGSDSTMITHLSPPTHVETSTTPTPTHGPNESTSGGPAKPETDPPARTTESSVPQNGAVVVTHNPEESGHTEAKPRTSYLVRLSAVAATGDGRRALLSTPGALELHDGTIRITVPVAERASMLAAIQALPGLKLVADPQTIQYDYAASLELAAATEQHAQDTVDRLQRQIAGAQDPTVREEAMRELEQATQRLAAAQDSLKHLEAEAGKAVFEIRLQAAAQ